MPSRGQFTDNIKQQMEDFLGRDSSQCELRLLPYIQSVMVNDQKVDPNKINKNERDIIQLWREAGHVEGGAAGVAITESFWEFICKIVWQGYVSHEDAPE